MDSHFTHGAWGESLGGIRYPLLADFHPRGAVADSYGLYLADAGITDRATVVIDAGGTIRHLSSAGPAGKRDMTELATICEGVDAAWQGDLPERAAPEGLAEGATLYVRDDCMFSRWALSARTNLQLQDALPVRNVSQDATAKASLEALGGKAQAPALAVGGEVLFESAEIVARLTAAASAL